MIAERRPLTASEMSVIPSERHGPRRLHEEVPEGNEPVLDDVVAEPARHPEQERVRVLDVVEHGLDPSEEPVAGARARVVGADAEETRDRHHRDDRQARSDRGEAQLAPEIVRQVTAGRVGPLRDRLRHAVERHRHHDDDETGEERQGRIGVQAARHDVAEALAADEAGDHDHGEREEDRLVDRRSSIRRASGRRTFLSVCAGVEPIATAASTVFVATPRMPSAVMRMAGGIA